jgi:hypothetical protein
MPVAHVFLVDGIKRCLIEREGDFDEAFFIGHALDFNPKIVYIKVNPVIWRWMAVPSGAPQGASFVKATI